MGDSENDLQLLVGKEITAIYIGEYKLVFDTTTGKIAYTVEGDCCSHSYFYDFVGVNKLLQNRKVVAVEDIKLEEVQSEDEWEDIKVYGYSITTEDPKFGEVTSVLSFRNSSNGYYGGWMSEDSNIDTDGLCELLTDWVAD